MPNVYSDYYLWVLFNQTSDAMAKVREKELNTHRISERHARLLFIIELIGRDATPTKISRWIMREPNTISEIIDRMEKLGLLKKVKDMRYKNQVRIEVTEKGQKMYRRSFVPKNIPDILSVLKDPERKKLVACLLKLREAAIDHLGIKYSVPLPPLDGDFQPNNPQ